nr:sulfotransferase family 2 domain-containing protein [Aliiroseovarius subalbicans]
MTVSVAALKVAYNPLPKAACSTVKAMLARVDNSMSLPSGDRITNRTWHEVYPTRRFRPHRWEPFEQEDWFRFAVVRDPLKRLMACYTDRVVKRRELHNSRKIKNGRVDLPKDPDPDFFFQNLERYREASSVVKHHSLGARLFLVPSLARYSRVYRTSEVGELASDLTKRTGEKFKPSRENASGMAIGLDDLKPKTVDALRPFLTREFDFLDSYYENPLA